MERWGGGALLVELGQAERAVGVLLFIFFDGVDVGGFGALGPAHVGGGWGRSMRGSVLDIQESDRGQSGS